MIAAQQFAPVKFTSADLERMPDDGNCYEIIEGELYVSRSPTWEHQYTCTHLAYYLIEWNLGAGLGVVNTAPGLVFADDDDVVPDLVWISHERLANGLDKSRHLQVAPELVVEMLSPGKANEFRDRQAKLDLYSRRGVQEYWIVDWMQQSVEVFRRKRWKLRSVETLGARNQLTSPLLPGFSCRISALFF